MTPEYFTMIVGFVFGIIVGSVIGIIAMEWKDKPKKFVDKKNYGKIVNLTLDLDPEERAISD